MILQGNSIRIPLPDNSVHCVVTSPPYFGLRSYNLPATVWGGDSLCPHIWQPYHHNPQPHGDNGKSGSGLQGGKSTQSQTRMGETESAFCQLCGGWLGCFGLEPTIALHVQNAVLVFREVKRVLRPDGILFMNYGDSYATSKNGRSAADTKAVGKDDRTFRDKPFSITELPAKNLCGIPWRVALALQDDGWILRSDIIWSKSNPMPESVTDRPAKSHEYIFMLAKSERYFYDAFAVRESAEYGRRTWKDDHYKNGDITIHHKGTTVGGNPESGRNRRSVWEIATEPYPAAHYATFPRKLVEPMIKAGTSAKGVCRTCSAPWQRVTERRKAEITKPRHFSKAGNNDRNDTLRVYEEHDRVTTGWQSTCKCPDNNTPIPAIILDPFCGSGTVGQVARELGHRFIGIDLSAEYLQKNALPRAERLTSQASLNQLPLFKTAA